MQIGGRWAFGATPPRGLPPEFVDAIARAEADASPTERNESWTLTWLEGRPIAELDGGRRVPPRDLTGAHDTPNASRAFLNDQDDDEDLFPE